MDIANILAFKLPYAQWVMRGEQYQDLDWLDDTTPKPTLEEITAWNSDYQESVLLADYSSALQSHVDSKAQEKNYENGFACASYVTSTNLNWMNEAKQFISWRDKCWEYAINIEQQVKAGTIQPPSLEDFINNAPQLNW